MDALEKNKPKLDDGVIRPPRGKCEKNKVYFINMPMIIRIPYCPKCNLQITEVTDVDAKTIMGYHCYKCGYSE